jgi:histone acetyltransferase (RNA polymerase elongator complex component)
VSEIVGKNSREIARELGDVLVKKLKIAVRSISGSSGVTGGGGGGTSTALLTTYNLKMIRIKTVQAIRFKKRLAGYRGIKEISTISSRSSERTLALNASLKPGLIEEAILETLMDVGVNVDEIRFEMSGTNIEIENLR